MSEKTEEITKRIKERLIQRYKEELFITEFRDKPSGFNHRIDGLLINLHPSRSDAIEAFEIKASRNDWLNELKNPEKSDKIVGHCDRMWLVTVEGIVKIEEIPENWGLKILKSKNLIVKKEAPLLNPHYDRDFILTLGQYVRDEFNSAIGDAKHEAYKEAKIDIEKQHDSEYYKQNSDIYEKRWQELQKKCEAFEKTTGIRIQYQKDKEIIILGELVNAVKDLIDNKSGRWWGDIEFNLKQIEEQIKNIREAKMKLDSIRLMPNKELHSIDRIV